MLGSQVLDFSRHQDCCFVRAAGDAEVFVSRACGLSNDAGARFQTVSAPPGIISVNTPVVARDDFGAGSARELREQFARVALGSAAATDVEIVIIAVFMTAR
jgi:hypothetical protein